MTRFCSDADILRYEPMVFGELHLPGQALAKGTAAVSGTALTAEDADFTAAKAEAGGVIYLREDGANGGLDGGYEIVSVDSATGLTISVLRGSSEDEAIAVGSAEEAIYRISTLRPQIEEVSGALAEALGIRDGADGEDIVDTDALRRATVYGVIAIVYAMHASRTENENYWAKNLHYRRLFERARERCAAGVDTNGDGRADETRRGGVGRLYRD